MTEEKERFIRDLAKENNSLVQSVLKPCPFAGSQPVLNWITSFEKLIRIIQGLPCDRQWLSVEVALLYNYSLVLHLATHLNTSIPLGCLGRSAPGNRSLRFSVNPEKTSADVIQAFLSRVEKLTGDRVFRTSATDEQMVLSSQLIKLLVSVSFPGSAKVMLLRLSVAYCLRLLDCQLLKEASDMSLQMFEQVLPRLSDLFQIESIDSCLNLPRICSEPASAASASLLTDSVRVVAAVSSFRLLDWNRCLAYVHQTVTFPLKLYCLYAEGYILFQQKTPEMTLCLLSELIKRVDLSRELSLNIRNLIGCCLSSQGKHRSAIQVFKKCLQEDFLFLLPLYNIAIQYQKLLLFDAEIETLQLLAKNSFSWDPSCRYSKLKKLFMNTLKLLESNQSPKCANDFDLLQFDAKESSHSRCQLVSRQQVLHLVAGRCLELERYDDAVGAYQELLSHLSAIENSLDAGSPDVEHHRSPPIDLLYSRTIYASICAKKFEEALSLCDSVLDKTNPSLDNVSNDILSQSHSRPFQNSYKAINESKTLSMPKDNLKAEAPRVTGKRLHEDEDCVSEHGVGGTEISRGATYTLFDASVLLYKAEALVNVDQRSDSLLCLNQAIAILELNWMDMGARNFEQPCPKKIKVDSTAEGGEQPCVWRQMLSDAYSMKGLILVTLDRTQDALHWSRLAYQLNNSDTEKVYNLSLLLYKLQRNNEATSLWLSHRELLAVSHDSLQLDVLVKRCSANLGKLTTKETNSSEGRYCLLDVEALKLLRTVKRKT